MIEEEIVKALVDGVPLVDKWVFALVMPQDTKRDALTYQIVGNFNKQCMEGGVYAYNVRVQIDVFSADYMQSIKIRNEVMAAMRSAFKVSDAFSVDMYEPMTLKYRQMCDMSILYQVPTAPIVKHGSFDDSFDDSFDI